MNPMWSAHASTRRLWFWAMVVGGCIALLGGFIWAELADRCHTAGGQYVICACYHPLVSFYMAGCCCWCYKPGNGAVQYLLALFWNSRMAAGEWQIRIRALTVLR